MRNYWSCTKLADYIRGNTKPQVASASKWIDWEESAKESKPVRYWLAETGLDSLQEIVYSPVTAVAAVRSYVSNRFISCAHACTASPQDITPGSWCDTGYRFMPCMFNELVNFVETEIASVHYSSLSKEDRNRFEKPRMFRTWRSPSAGVEKLALDSLVLNKEIIDNAPDDPHKDELSQFAIRSKEVLDLYLWWTEVYRNRPDPYDTVSQELGVKPTLDMLDYDEAIVREWSKRVAAIEQCYDNEDEEMLIRLIKIRKWLWT